MTQGIDIKNASGKHFQIDFPDSSKDLTLSTKELASTKLINSIAELKTIDGSVTDKLNVLGYYAAGDGGGTLTLNGSGAEDSSAIARVVIPTSTSARIARCIITAKQYTATVMRVYITIPELGIHTQTNSPSLNRTSLRTNSEVVNLFRLYWTPADANQTQFFAMRTYIES